MAVKDRLVELAGEKLGTDYQTELARRLGETWQWVHYRVNGTTAIKADEIPRFAQALDVHPCTFFDAGYPEPQSPDEYQPTRGAAMLRRFVEQELNLDPKAALAFGLLADLLNDRQSPDVG